MVQNREAPNALCIHSKTRRELKSFQITTKTVNRTRRISKVVWQRIPGAGPATEKNPMTTSPKSSIAVPAADGSRRATGAADVRCLW